jgi:hypothetical protein
VHHGLRDVAFVEALAVAQGVDRMSEYKLAYSTFPLMDSGIGISQGYESDKAFLAAMEAERAKLDPEVREAIESIEQDTLRGFLGIG